MKCQDIICPQDEVQVEEISAFSLQMHLTIHRKLSILRVHDVVKEKDGGMPRWNYKNSQIFMKHAIFPYVLFYASFLHICKYFQEIDYCDIV